MLNLAHVRTFLAVVETGGIRAAARRLALSPATVVDHLDHLERDLSASLLVRRRPAASLTREGALFAPLARALLATAEDARTLVSGGPVRLAASNNIGAYLLPPLIADFQRAGRPVDLWIGTNPSVAERLERGQADIAAMEWWDGRKGFEAQVWRDEPLVAIAPPGHRWEQLEAVPFEALEDEVILGGEPGTGSGTALRRAFGDRVARLRIVGGFGGTEAVKRSVRARLGVSIVLAATVSEEAARGLLVVRPLAGVSASKQLSVVVPLGAGRGSGAARLLDFLIGTAPPASLEHR